MDRGQQRDGQNPYIHHHSTYEMSVVEGSTANLTTSASGAETGDAGAFYSEISSLQDNLKIFNHNVARVDDLHSRLLNNADDAVSQRSAALLAELLEETSALSELSGTLKRRIQALEMQPSRDRDAQVQKQQTALIKSKFLDAIQNYQQVEQRYQQKYKLRMERQLMIVKPDATPEEIWAVLNDESGDQVFSQALIDLNSHGGSRAAYREVQARHQEIQRMEQTIAELAQLFNDMKSEVIDNVETTAVTVEKDLEAKLSLANNAVVSARVAKKRLWICISILTIIVIIIVIAVTVPIVKVSHA